MLEQSQATEQKFNLDLIRQELGQALTPIEHLRPPEGVSTGIDVLDDFLLWRGLPKGDLSLFLGKPGTGATSLWLQTAKEVQRRQGWAAWVNSEWELLPNSIVQQGVDLKKLLVVKKPTDSTQLFWILQELISSGLFQLVGCHLPQSHLRSHQLQKLKKLARTHQVALAFVCHGSHRLINPLFSFVIECQRDFHTIHRALHRPSPFTIASSMIYGRTATHLKIRGIHQSLLGMQSFG